MNRRRTAMIIVSAGIVISTAGGIAAATGTTEPAPPDDSTPSSAVIDPGDGGNYAPAIDPANFVDGVDNPYFPLQPGARWVYEGDSDGEPERIEVEVLEPRRDIMGISAVIVRDTAYVADEIVEDTYDWYAQDADGNVWYLGEDTREYEDGVPINSNGAWEYGVDGALPGIVMPAHPTVGDAYRQELYAGEAEDMGEILEVDATVTIGLGEYTDVVVTEDWNPLDPEVIENKSYAPGVGVIYETHVAGGEGTAELVEFTPGG